MNRNNETFFFLSCRCNTRTEYKCPKVDGLLDIWRFYSRFESVCNGVCVFFIAVGLLIRIRQNNKEPCYFIISFPLFGLDVGVLNCVVLQLNGRGTRFVAVRVYLCYPYPKKSDRKLWWLTMVLNILSLEQWTEGTS